ncbi:hypothetical protein DM01DRAFT_328190 [Hesseltinella vesiculosa]|uniref:SWIM-type domain-containing protein n=1 Tax=Hesseltinella vesiculosa TaxID=101127 RepID=A0A1X2GRI9_9FUNG|nr:hypothetical protein DM01DRAFT_328190 [Hesseltinella vesiculosa]
MSNHKMPERHAFTLFDTIIDTIRGTRKLTEDQVRVLHELLGTLILDALNFLDNEAVIRHQCGPEAKRIAYSIADGERTVLCFIYPRYCSCDSFVSKTLCQRSELMCCHVLAAILYDALDHNQPKRIWDEDSFGELLFDWTVPA